MLTNTNKFASIAQQCVNTEIPFSITATPDINHQDSASPLYQQLKNNQHFIRAILESAKEYDEMKIKLNKNKAIIEAARGDSTSLAVGTQIKIQGSLYAVVYDTQQFNFENRNCCIYYKDLFGGNDPLFTFDNVNDTIVLKNGWQSDVEDLMKQYHLIPECIKTISFKDDTPTKDGIISFIGCCADEFEKYECGNKVTLTIPIQVNNYDEMKEDNSTLAQIEFERLCCHFNRDQQPNNSKDNDIKDAKPVFMKTNQVKKMINVIRKKHARHHCAYASIQEIQEKGVIMDCTGLDLSKDSIPQEKLSTLGCIHNYKPFLPMSVSRYSWTSHYIYPIMKDYFIYNRNGIMQEVTNGLSEYEPHALTYALSTFKLGITSPIDDCQPHTIIDMHSTAKTGNPLKKGLIEYHKNYKLFFGKRYEREDTVFGHMDCLHGNTDAWNHVYNEISSSVYLEDAWRYILGMTKTFTYRYIPLWSYLRIQYELSEQKENITLWTKDKQNLYLNCTGSIMKDLKHSLTSYEILLHYNSLGFILSCKSILAYPNGAVIHNYNVTSRDTLYEKMNENIVGNKAMNDFASAVNSEEYEMKYNIKQTKGLLGKIDIFLRLTSSSNEQHKISVNSDIKIEQDNKSITITVLPKDFPEIKISHCLKTNKTYLLPHNIELMMNVIQGSNVIKFENQFVNIDDLKRFENDWIPFLPYFTDIFVLRSKFSINQYVKLLWRFEREISGNDFWRIDEYLSKSIAEQRATQLQFMLQLKNLSVQKLIKTSLFPVDSWDSGKKQPEKAKSTFDLSLIQLFHQWLDKEGLHHKKTALEVVQKHMFDALSKLSNVEEHTWVGNISSLDIKKLKSGWALCTSPLKVACYGELKNWLSQQLASNEENKNESDGQGISFAIGNID
eukprot:73765_1